MEIFKILKILLTAKHKEFLAIDAETYTKWKYLLIMVVFLNRNYITCSIRRKQYKKMKNIVVIGLKNYGYVKRRTAGYARKYLDLCKNNNKTPKCIYCEKKLTYKNITADHIIPISKKGNNCQVNLVACCGSCNKERGNMKFNTYMKMKKGDKYNKHIFI